MSDQAPEATDGPAALYEVRGNVGLITLNRPRALNAVNGDLSLAAGEALEQAAQDDDVRAVVITGSGRGFCAGADLKELGRGRRLDAPGHPEWGFAGIVRHWVAKPTIAAVNGFALGGGTEIVLACDMAVIDESASLGLPEVRRGLYAAAGGALRTAHQVPLKVALEIALTGDPVDARRAYELGLVNRVAPAGTALDVALALADRVATAAPLAVQHTKAVVHRTSSSGEVWDRGPWEHNKSAMAAVFTSEDAKEGTRAFAEKRAPVWTGR